MLTAMGISLAALLVVLLVVVFIKSRRAAADRAVADSTRRRAMMEECGDDVIWELSKMRPMVAPKEFEAPLSKRSFLKRTAFGVSAFATAWLAARGSDVALGAESLPAKERMLKKNGPVKEDFHQDSTDHYDNHSDSGGVDAHSDSPGNHTDTGGVALGAEPRSPEERLLKKDGPVKMDAHQDSTDHYDNHTDSGDPSSHGDSHSDGGNNHTDAGG